jgi:CheY-like chemotaxis protein
MAEKVRKVLIIDDDEINNFVCEKVIKQSGLAEEAKSLKSAPEALDYIRGLAQESPDLVPEVILLDINMPFMDGWEFMESLKGFMPQLLSKLPVVAILSSSVYEADAEKADEHPDIQEYITKPLTQEALKKVLKQHVLY